MVQKNKGQQFILNLLFIILCLLCVLPFVLLISSSFTEEAALTQKGYWFWPWKVSMDAYKYLMNSGSQILTSYKITLLVTAIGTVSNIMLTVLFAYPLSRREMPARNFFAFFVFFTMLFNGGIIPAYMMYANFLHLKNTFWALIIPWKLLGAFNIIMMRSYFTASIPNELVEAARIDGAREYGILFGIMLPLSKPMLATIGLMTGLGFWNDWTNSIYFVTQKNLYSIQALLNDIMTNIQFLQNNTQMQQHANQRNLPSASVRMAIAVIGILPIFAIYPFVQKYFVKGIVVGGVKG